MATATAIPGSRWSVPLILAIALGVSLAVFIYARSLLHQNRIDSTTFFGGSLPPGLETLMAVRVKGGELGEFFDPVTKQKISLIFADRQSARHEPVAVQGVMNLIDKQRIGTEADGTVSPIILKYAAAQFNVLSAGKVAATEVPLAGAGLSAERFETTRGARYLMGIINLEQKQILFLVLRKGESPDSNLVGQVLERIPGVSARVGQQTDTLRRAQGMQR